MFYIDTESQNVILNAGNFVGRIAAGWIATYCGIPNTVTGSTLGSGIVIFMMITLSTRAGAASIGLFIGFFLGVCQSPAFSSFLHGE